MSQYETFQGERHGKTAEVTGEGARGGSPLFRREISAGDILMALAMLAAVATSHFDLKSRVGSLAKDVQLNSKRISANSAADTRRANGVSAPIIKAIGELKSEVAVLQTNLENDRSRYNDELRRLRDEVSRVRFGLPKGQ